MTHIDEQPDSDIRGLPGFDRAQELAELVTAQGRHIDTTSMRNLREVGGYPTLNGGVLRWHALYRSDAPVQLGDSGLAVVAGLGLRTIVDLRTPGEAEGARSDLAVLPAQTMEISVLGPDLESLPLELGAIYRYMVDDRGAAIAAAIRPLCADGALPALVHCTAGKDRTGVVVALILAVVGVADDLIAADYSLSAGYLDQDQTPVIGQLSRAAGISEEVTASLLVSPAMLIDDALARVRAGWGSAEQYLLDHGLRPAELAALRTALVA